MESYKEFKDCSPYNPFLEVSQDGTVRDKKTGNILEQTFLNEYSIVKNPSNKEQYEFVHRLVALTWLNDEYRKKCPVVHHKDRNRSNNHVDNLEWETNDEHAKEHGYQVNEMGAWCIGL